MLLSWVKLLPEVAGILRAIDFLEDITEPTIERRTVFQFVVQVLKLPINRDHIPRRDSCKVYLLRNRQAEKSQKRPQPLGTGLGNLFDVRPDLRSAHHPLQAQRNEVVQ